MFLIGLIRIPMRMVFLFEWALRGPFASLPFQQASMLGHAENIRKKLMISTVSVTTIKVQSIE